MVVSPKYGTLMRIGPAKRGAAVVTGVADVVGRAAGVAAAVLASVEEMLRRLFDAASAGTIGSTEASPTAAAVVTIPIVRRRRWTFRLTAAALSR